MPKSWTQWQWWWDRQKQYRHTNHPDINRVLTCFCSTAYWNTSWCLSGRDRYYLWGSVRVGSRWIVVGGGLRQEGPGEGLATPYDAQFHWDLAPSRAISSARATPLPSDGLQQTNGHYHEPLSTRWMYFMQYSALTPLSLCIQYHYLCSESSQIDSTATL